MAKPHHAAYGASAQPRGEHRNRGDPPAPLAGLLGEHLHHLLVGEDVRAADVEGAVDLGGQRGGGHEVVQDVLDRDRLDQVVQPLRRHHHRQPGGEVAQHRERDRPVADDGGGLQHRRRYAAVHQDAADLHARGQVRGQLPVRVQPGEVDEAADPGAACRGGEVLGQPAVPGHEVTIAVHAVQQVVGDVQRRSTARPQGAAQVLLGAGVPLDHLDLVPPGVREPVGVAGEHPDGPAFVQQPWHQQPTYVTGRPRHQRASLVHAVPRPFD